MGLRDSVDLAANVCRSDQPPMEWLEVLFQLDVGRGSLRGSVLAHEFSSTHMYGATRVGCRSPAPPSSVICDHVPMGGGGAQVPNLRLVLGNPGRSSHHPRLLSAGMYVRCLFPRVLACFFVLLDRTKPVRRVGAGPVDLSHLRRPRGKH